MSLKEKSGCWELIIGRLRRISCLIILGWTRRGCWGRLVEEKTGDTIGVVVDRRRVGRLPMVSPVFVTRRTLSITTNPCVNLEFGGFMFEGLLQPSHLLVILVVGLFVFGPKKLPELGKGLAEGIRGFKDAIK